MINLYLQLFFSFIHNIGDKMHIELFFVFWGAVVGICGGILGNIYSTLYIERAKDKKISREKLFRQSFIVIVILIILGIIGMGVAIFI